MTGADVLSCLIVDDSDEKTSWKLVDVVDENFEIFSLDVTDEVVDDKTGISGGVKIPTNVNFFFFESETKTELETS